MDLVAACGDPLIDGVLLLGLARRAAAEHQRSFRADEGCRHRGTAPVSVAAGQGAGDVGPGCREVDPATARGEVGQAGSRGVECADRQDAVEGRGVVLGSGPVVPGGPDEHDPRLDGRVDRLLEDLGLQPVSCAEAHVDDIRAGRGGVVDGLGDGEDASPAFGVEDAFRQDLGIRRDQGGNSGDEGAVAVALVGATVPVLVQPVPPFDRVRVVVDVVVAARGDPPAERGVGGDHPGVEDRDDRAGAGRQPVDAREIELRGHALASVESRIAADAVRAAVGPVVKALALGGVGVAVRLGVHHAPILAELVHEPLGLLGPASSRFGVIRAGAVERNREQVEGARSEQDRAGRGAQQTVDVVHRDARSKLDHQLTEPTNGAVGQGPGDECRGRSDRRGHRGCRGTAEGDQRGCHRQGPGTATVRRWTHRGAPRGRGRRRR